MADRNLAAPEQPLCRLLATLRLETQHHMRIVVQPAAFDKGMHICRQFVDFQTGNEAAEIIGMRADIACGTTRTGLGRVGAPDSLFGTRLLDGFRQPVLRIFHLHQTDRAESARFHQFPCMPHHRIAGVIMRQDEQRIGLVGDVLQLFGVLQIGGQRLVADDMDATLQKRLRRRIMHVVGRDDRHRLYAILV